MFVDVGEIIVPVYSRDGKNNLMVVRMELEVGEVMSVEDVRYMLPRLRDAYIGTLSTLAGRGELVEESQRNATIKRALKLASDRVLGPDAIQRRPPPARLAAADVRGREHAILQNNPMHQKIFLYLQ